LWIISVWPTGQTKRAALSDVDDGARKKIAIKIKKSRA
jgi:hypothetical protein